MLVLNAFDYSWARPDPTEMRAAGIELACRYLFGPGKGIDLAERDALLAAGLGVVYNYEAEAGNHLLGATQGAIDGSRAREYLTALNAPPGTPIYFSCDREVSGWQMPTVLAYLKAADSAANPSRCYAQFSVCEAYGRPAWQTVAWSYNQISRWAVLYQYAIDQDFHGSAVDYNTILNAAALGAHWPTGHALEHTNGGGIELKPTPKPPTSEEDEDMPYIVFRAAKPQYAFIVHTGGKGQPLLDAATTRGYRANGAKAIPIAEKDWGNTLRVIGIK